MDKRQTRSISSRKIRAVDKNGSKSIECLFATFTGRYDICPGVYETIAPNAFDETLHDDIRALVDHDTRLVLGRTTAGTLSLRVDSQGLWGRILINEKDGDAMNLYARVQRRDVSGCSFGFDVLDEANEFIPATQESHWVLKKVKLYEVSICTFPAYKDTIAESRKERNKAFEKRKTENFKQRCLARLRKSHH